VILGAGWPSGPVALTRTTAGAVSALGTANAARQPVSQQAGSFSFTATVTAGTSFRVSAAQGELVRTADVVVPDSCPLAVVARFADGPPVNGVTRPGGGAVLSVCHPHDSGTPLGPVKVLIGIGPLPPVPVFTILRVPPRPQPPLL